MADTESCPDNEFPAYTQNPAERCRQPGVALQPVMVEKPSGVGDKTAKRDLPDLVQRGLIVYLRQGREGQYRLGDSGAVSA